MLLTKPVITSQVFGNSGTRPFREVASEAETPRRSGSGVAQEESQTVPAKFAPVEALANALSEAQTSSDRSNALIQMVLQLDEVLTSLRRDSRMKLSRWTSLQSTSLQDTGK